jgi:hypothetical protein
MTTAVVVVLLIIASRVHAQYNPIPNFSGNLAGQQFRGAINNKLSGTDTISPQLVHLTFAQLPVTVVNGQSFYLDDGAPGAPCAGGGTGAVATGVNGVWSCGQGGGTAGLGGSPTSVSCYHLTTLVGTGAFVSGSTNSAGSFTTPNSMTDSDNCTVTFSRAAAASRICIWTARNSDSSQVLQAVADTATTTTAKVDFNSSGATSAGHPLTIGYSCL